METRTMISSGKISLLEIFRRTIAGVLIRIRPPFINEYTSARRFAFFYPQVWRVLEERFGIPVAIARRFRTMSLNDFCKRLRLPPPQVLFLNVQLETKRRVVKELSPDEAR